MNGIVHCSVRCTLLLVRCLEKFSVPLPLISYYVFARLNLPLHYALSNKREVWEQFSSFGNNYSCAPTVSIKWPPQCLGCCKPAGELPFGCDRTCFHLCVITTAVDTRMLSASLADRKQSQSLLWVWWECCRTCCNVFFLFHNVSSSSQLSPNLNFVASCVLSNTLVESIVVLLF